MSYELFEKACALNETFEVIPTKVKILAEGIIIDKNGYMQYKDKTYIPNMVKLEELPTNLQKLFLEKKRQLQKKEQSLPGVEKPKNKLDDLNIPMYRAKRKDSDKYVIGHYIPNHVIGDYETDDSDEREEWTEHFLIKSLSQDTESDENYYNFEGHTEIDPTTLAIKMPERDFYMSLDIETGKGGDKISEHKVLAWNGSMMNCSIIEFDSLGVREDYIIDLDSCDFNKMQVIGIQE